MMMLLVKKRKKQVYDLERWVNLAVYIPDEMRDKLKYWVQNSSDIEGTDMKLFRVYDDEAVKYLAENCPIHWAQAEAEKCINEMKPKQNTVKDVLGWFGIKTKKA